MTIQILSPANVGAQQQAGQSIPETGNPQEGPVQPFQQRGGLQDPVQQDILNQPRRITLPTGKPAQPPKVKNSNSQNMLTIAVLGLIGLGLLGLWLSTKEGTTDTKLKETKKIPKQANKRKKH